MVLRHTTANGESIQIMSFINSRSALRVLASSATTASLAMGASLTPLAAHAQSGATANGTTPGAIQESTALPRIDIRGRSISNTNHSPVGISRLGDTVQDTPKTINVISHRLIEQQHVTSLEQALKNVPGITMSTGEGNGGQNGDQFSIRGMSAKGDIYVDGLRDFGAYKRDSFDTESIEVVKGPSGAAFGVGNVAGIINQTTKRAVLDTATSVNQSIGSASTFRTTVDSNVKLGDTTAVRVNGMFQDGNVPDRDHVRDDRRGVAIDFGTGIGTSTEWHLNYEYLHRRGVPDYGISMAQGDDGIYRPLTEYGVPGLSPSTSYVRDTDRDSTDTHLITSLFKKALGNGITIENDTRATVYERDFSATTPNTLTNANLHTLLDGTNIPLRYGAGGGVAYRQSGWAVQNVLSGKFDFHLGQFRNQAMLGLDTIYERDHRDLGKWTGRINNQTVIDPSHVMPGDHSIAYGATTRSADATDIGVFASDRFWLNDQVSLLGALRWDYFRSSFATNASSIGGTSNTNKLSPSISAIWEPTKATMFYAAFSRTYRPIGTDIAYAVGGKQAEVPSSGPASEPERSDTVEIGSKLDLMNGRLGLTGALFQTKKTHAYSVDPETGDILAGFKEDGDGLRVRGFEVGLSGKITRHWSANLAYAYLDGKVTYSSIPFRTGENAPDVPHNNLTLWTSYDVPQVALPIPGKLVLGGGLQYASSYLANGAKTANPGHMPHTFALDAMIAYQYGRYSLSLNGYNLTDHLNYQSAFSSARAVPVSGRTVTLNFGVML